VDILWTVFALVCEVWVAGSILCAYNGDDFGGAVCGVCFILFPVSAGCTLGKLFPPSNGYIGCSSLQCEKAVHNAVMTLVSFPFDFTEAIALHIDAKRGVGLGRLSTCVKLLAVMASLGYLIYDTLLQDKTTPLSLAMVVVASVFDLCLICFECITLCAVPNQEYHPDE
jgi:hypothetical protein